MTPSFFRLLRITQVFLKHDLDEFVSTLHLFRLYRYACYLLPWHWGRKKEPRAVRLRQALEELGPVFVKFGQILSTRPDLLPEDIARELSKLQDEVPPFEGRLALEEIETAYGESIDQHLMDFEITPLASASVAQVHCAKLLDGTKVVVKVLRPDIKQVIERDIGLLYTLARLAERYWSEGPRLRPVEVVDEYNKTIHDELNLRREAANASQLRINFQGTGLLYVPEVYWDHTRESVMVMEYIDGIPIRNIDALKAANIDMRKLAHDGVEIFFTQAFRDGFFHADMHPGNIFVTPEGQYRAVDFGIMGTLSAGDKRYLAENFLGFFNRDYHAVADAHLRAGWVPGHTRVEEFEAAIRTVCEPIFARPISEISFGHFVVELFKTAREFQMPIQPQLVLLQKTLLNIEGLGRQLYPELDLWDTAKPFLERWMNEQMGPRAFVSGLKKELPRLGKMIPEMPRLAHDLMRKLNEDETASQRQVEELRKLRDQIARGQRRQFFTTLAAALLVGAALTFDHQPSTEWWGIPLPSWFLGLGAVILVMVNWPKTPRN